MKKLPKIYKNNIEKKINNNKTVYHIKNDTKDNTFIKKDEDVIKTLDKIFSGIGYSYNIEVIIKTKDKKYKTTLVARTSNNIVTIDNEVIAIDDIINIEII